MREIAKQTIWGEAGNKRDESEDQLVTRWH